MKKILTFSIIILFLIIAIGVAFLSSRNKGTEDISRPKGGIFESAKIDSLYRQVNGYLAKNNEMEAINTYRAIINSFPESARRDAALLALGNYYKKTGKFAEAKEYYLNLISGCPDSKLLKDAQDQSGDLNVKMLFSSMVMPDSMLYAVKKGDNLTTIANAFGTTIDLIRKSNNLKSDVIRVGMKLKIARAKFSVIVDKSQNTLTLKSNEDVIKVYTVATGKDNCTPMGTFKIINKLENPTWYSTNAVVPPDSPNNILGSRWMGLSVQGYGIHGTTEPGSIGRQATAGCVRMLNTDVEELYVILPVGTEVTVVD